MLLILSPAKSLDFESKFKSINSSKPIFLNEVEKLVSNLKQLSINSLKDLMSISDNLATLNYQRFQNFNDSTSRQAIMAFDGDVYDGIDKKNFDEEDFNFAQQHLLILSGLYGLLRPLDLIKPYRLEMGTDFKKFNFFTKNLYQFWNDKITLEINKNPAESLINLASQEYFKAINPLKINKKIIEIIFKEKKAEQYKIIGISAKKARGLMANYIIKNKIIDPQKIKNFSLENYQFSPKFSNENQWVFIR